MTTRLGRPLTGLFALALSLTTVPGWAAPPKDDGKKSRLPAAVVKAIDLNRPGAEIGKLEIEDEEGITLYDVEFKGGQGEIEVAEDGTVLDLVTIIDLKDVPEPAAAMIKKAAGGGAIRQVEKSEVRARVEKTGGKGRLSVLAASEYVYEAELAKGGEIEVAADGTVLKAPKSMGKGAPEKK